MRVRELISIAVDLFDQPDLDQIFRAVNNTIRDINGVFRGIHKTVDVYAAGVFVGDYRYKSKKITGTVRRRGAPNFDTVDGAGTAFTAELAVNDEIIIAGTVYTVLTISHDNVLTINRTAGAADTVDLNCLLIEDKNIITLTGVEKTILRVLVNSHICKELTNFDTCSAEEYAYIRTGLSELLFNYLPPDSIIEIEALFAIPQVTGKDDEIEFPYAWESLLTNGLLHYISNIPAYAGRDKQGYGENYYRMLNDLAANTNVSLLIDYSAWNYAKAEID